MFTTTIAIKFGYTGYILYIYTAIMRYKLKLNIMTLQELLKMYKLPTNYLLKNDKLNFNNYIRYNCKSYYLLK